MSFISHMQRFGDQGAQIDAIDDQIIDLLAERIDVIRAVGDVKARENIPSYLRDRVNEVQARCAERAKGKGVDPSLVKDLYTLLIEYSCALEEKIITVPGEFFDVNPGRRRAGRRSRFRSYTRFSFGPARATLEVALDRLERMVAGAA